MGFGARLALLVCAPLSAFAQERSPEGERYCDTPPCTWQERAYFKQPVARYGHAVLGDTVEWGTLVLGAAKVILPPSSVFEDLAPRLVDVDGDGVPEAVVIESHARKGAQLAIYRLNGGRLVKHAATPYIGTRYRWLAPAGIADFDQNGTLDFAYVDRPHLAKTLRIWSYESGQLREIAAIGGLANHRIGEDFISGGLRNCKGVREIVTADQGWTRVLGTRFRNGAWISRELASRADSKGFAKAMAC